jgi:UDP-N-acetylglucosamine acyltransferase
MKTIIKNNNLFMTGVHIAHDCIIGNENIFVNQVTLGGHVNIMNNVVVGVYRQLYNLLLSDLTR